MYIKVQLLAAMHTQPCLQFPNQSLSNYVPLTLTTKVVRIYFTFDVVISVAAVLGLLNSPGLHNCVQYVNTIAPPFCLVYNTSYQVQLTQPQSHMIVLLCYLLLLSLSCS